MCEESGSAVIGGEITIISANNIGICDDTISINPVKTIK